MKTGEKCIARRLKSGQFVLEACHTRKKPNVWSVKQKAARSRFASLCHFASRNHDLVVHDIWTKHYIGNLNGPNLFKKLNKFAFNSVGELVDPLLLKMSVGNLPLVFNLKVNLSDEDNSICITWALDDELNNRARMKDILCYGILYDDEALIPHYTNICREEQGAVLENDEALCHGDYIYLFFASTDREDYSESMSFKL